MKQFLDIASMVIAAVLFVLTIFIDASLDQKNNFLLWAVVLLVFATRKD